MKKIITIVLVLGMATMLSARPKGNGGPKLDMMDTDNDGTITRAEWDSFHDSSFKMMDSDSDGKVTQEEADKAREEMRSKMKSKKSN